MPNQSIRKKQRTQRSDRPAVIVGIGSGGASMQALETFFANLGAETDAAFVVALSSEGALPLETVMEKLVGRHGKAVRRAEDGARLERGAILVAAPDEIVTFVEDAIRVTASDGPAGRGSVDSMLISLARHAHERAVAVILAANGAEGSAGVAALKKFGGLSIAQADDAQVTGEAAVGPAPVADLHVAVARMPGEIARYAANLAGAQALDTDRMPREIEGQIGTIVAALRNVTGHDFHGYKRGTFVRRVQRRMQVLQIDRLTDYIERLRGEPQEVQNLFQDLLIGVTQFFRDPEEFEALEREIPALFEGKGPNDQLRVWVLGCATGEEAYSIAILLREHMATIDRPPDVQIFATDLDARALGLARAGRYSEAIRDQVRPDRLKRWFIPEGATYCVKKELREMCIFSPHSIVKDAPFSRLDILSCRNLLIYLNSEMQNRVLPIFHFALKPGGILFLGSAENVTRHARLFAPVDRKSRLFRRAETANRIIPDFPLTSRSKAADPSETARHNPTGRLSSSISRQAEAMAERYAPAYLVVDAHGDVLHFSGRTGRYIEPSPGAPTLNLNSLVHRDLRLDVGSALTRAIAQGRRVEMPRMVIRQDDQSYGVTIVVEPIGDEKVRSFVVLFQDLGIVPQDGGWGGGGGDSDEHVSALEAELRLTRERLQATIEEQESTNEELKSSNEEYQSINEELQSANEELETSKEELQSVNEELQTVNGELANRVSELGRTNSDLKNLLESTQIATVFLDSDLCIRNFTPAATDVLHLLENDVGRPLDHVVSRLCYPELVDDVRMVLRKLVPIERQVVDKDQDRHYAVRVLPYRNTDNYIQGAVLTFTDLTDVLKAQKALRTSEERFRVFMNSSCEAAYRMSPDWEEMRYLAGRDFLEDMPEPSTDWMESYIAEEDRATIRAAIDEAIAGKKPFVHEHRVRNIDGTFSWTLSRAVPMLDDEGHIVEWLGTATDMTARHEAEQALRASERRLQLLIEGMPQLVWRSASGGHWTWASPQWLAFTGQSAEAAQGLGWLNALHPEDRDSALAFWKGAAAEGQLTMEGRIRSASGEYRWFKTRASPVRNREAEILEWLGTSTDIHELRELQDRQRVLVAELQHRVRNMLTVVRSVFSRTVDSSGDMEALADHFRGRLDALARTQVVITQDASGEVDLENMIRDELLSVGVVNDEAAEIGGPEVALTPATAELFGLAIHELTTNSLKYGALLHAEARLIINWETNLDQSGIRHLRFIWREQGVPAVSVEPRKGGFGRELIEEALPYRLGAETRLEFLGGGVRCSIGLALE
ncbi:CheR family methyltransferase [Stakelama pacifica]|uniref:histidine kinase n=1 Tax=Stakelama pacifica TaxID=517720 RepID=A0A4R6G077_9SPHN|nr:CheR family methyltransferase [Stakelama pacifica]TDN86855.1 two-component system CheB/CheR fusion protein [Stakelama pacifica]GGO90878.1 hypothetical protein GCM10011329_04260 [Stakelama pacifica]